MTAQDCPCKKVDYHLIDKPVREFVRELHKKNICTHSSEGGGKGHGAPEFAYVETYLTKENLQHVKRSGFLLDKVHDQEKRPLFLGSGLKYGAKTSFFLIGLKRDNLSDKQIETKLCSLLPLLKKQRLHKNWKKLITSCSSS